MLLVVDSAGVNWWGFAEGEAWMLSALVACVALAACAYLIQQWIARRGSA